MDAQRAVSRVVDDVLAALSDPRRRELLDELAERGEATATTLAQGSPISRQAIVKHLAVLDQAGLVASDKVGREVRYHVLGESMGVTAQWMASRAAAWDDRLARVKRIAESGLQNDGD